MPDQEWPVETKAYEDLVASHAHLLEDTTEHANRMSLVQDIAKQLDIIRVPLVPIADDRVSLAKWQTGFRDQTGRGACYAFAAVAAMEAAYKRDHGVELDLSEQFAFHLNKVGELYDTYLTDTTPHENNSSYWGFQGASDIVDKLARSAIPEESAAPYLEGTAMDTLKNSLPGTGALDWNSNQEQLDLFEFSEQHIPTPSRAQAKYRVTGYAAIPGNPTPEQIEAVITAGHEVVVDIPGHCFLIVGFNRTTRQWLIKNSWGEGQFITRGYDQVIYGGRYVTSVAPPFAAPQREACWLGRWQMDHDGWRGELVIRRTTNYRRAAGQPTKLGNYYREGQRYDVNGFVEDDGQQLHFWIADTTDKVAPGSQTGQEFRAYVFSWQPDRAAGTTWWNGTPYGISLSRSPLPGEPTQGFDASTWLDSWAMDHDGWQGRLDLTSVAPVAGTYHASDGRALSVRGTLDPNQPHVLHLSIPFDANAPQPFDLLGHTWERDVFAGTTVWGGRTFGVCGQRAPVNVRKRIDLEATHLYRAGQLSP